MQLHSIPQFCTIDWNLSEEIWVNSLLAFDFSMNPSSLFCFINKSPESFILVLEPNLFPQMNYSKQNWLAT